MNGLLYVAAGGALGASARHLAGIAAGRALGDGYPYGTFIANILGGFLMGLLVGWLAQRVPSGTSGDQSLRLLLGVGLLGGFTTFSSFSLDAVLMYQRKAYGLMAGYIGGSVILSIAALMMGLMLARKAFGA